MQRLNTGGGPFGQWSGSVYSKDSGDTYYGTMRMRGPNTLHVEACAFSRFYCNGNNWTRITKGLPDGNLGRMGINFYAKDPSTVSASKPAKPTLQLLNHRRQEHGSRTTPKRTPNIVRAKRAK